MKLAPPELDSHAPSSHSSSVVAAPHTVTLSNGRYSVRLNEAGAGQSKLPEFAVTRSIGDEVCDADGFFIYLRDLDDNAVWSASYQPTRATPTQYEFSYQQNVAQFLRVDRGIECRTRVAVSPEHDCEVRLCRIINRGAALRRIEVTSYLEWVLAPQEADANHPAFSKLFVETKFCDKHQAIFAKRRPRAQEDSELWGVHHILADWLATGSAKLQFETNRVRFLGRGRSPHSPNALEPAAKLSGDTGPVLDPVASLRLEISLAPGESREIAFLLGAANNRPAIDAMLAAVADLAAVRELFALAEVGPASNGHPVHLAPPEFVTPRIKPKYNRSKSSPARAQASTPESQPKLRFENSYGGFTEDGREYIIRLQPTANGSLTRPPMPWANIIANEQAGFLVSEAGAGYMWAGNSRCNRVTAWHNDPVCDPFAEAFWIRDEDLGAYWSPTPGPAPSGAEYTTRHGLGHSIFEHTCHELKQQLTMFMACDAPLKMSLLRLENTSDRSRRLSLFSFVHWGLGGLASDTAIDIETAHDAKLPAIWAKNPHRDLYGDYTAFSAPVVGDRSRCEVSHTCDRTAFIGRYRDLEKPAAVVALDELDGQAGSNLDPCAAWQLSIELEPGEVYECAFLLGEVIDTDTARSVIAKHHSLAAVHGALKQSQEFWRKTLSGITIETPDPEINFMINGWLAYQNLSCRMWARSAYYQPGGAFGYRDQLQDSSALVYLRPEITRAQILRHASRQFVEGDVLHWWHPDNGFGVRTRFSDDLLWLPLLTAEYVKRTGDTALLDEVTPFVSAPPLAAGHQEAYLRPTPAGTSATVYEHCCRALDRGLTRGQHGLPLIGCGDWNDGFSRVGKDGIGESVWLGFFIEHTLQLMLPICQSRGDDARVARYSQYREQLLETLNTVGWDGNWYRRAYYDNGEVMGSAQSDECQIDALAQAWAVISGVAPPDRAALATQAVEERLVCADPGMIRLLTPAFNSTPNDPGYIKGYLKGIRENGGQYTHGVLWFIRAMAELGRGTRAVELLRMITPVHHTRNKAETDRYQTEPYVVAADVYGEPPHVGRGGWTWYTGSAGWMFRVAVESILGFATENGDTIVLNPSISAEWPQCRLTYRLPDGNTTYAIIIENPSGKQHGVAAATLDGAAATVVDGAARIPILSDGQHHNVVIRL
ncbi:MAG: hypothetical protein U0805_19145 [Pirellulales bacterium]